MTPTSEPEGRFLKKCRQKKKERHNRISAKWKLLLSLLLLTVLSLSFIWFAQSFLLDKVYLGIQKKELREAGQELLTADPDSLSERMAEIGAEKNICISSYVIYKNSWITCRGDYKSKSNCNCLLHRLLSVSGDLHSSLSNPNGILDRSVLILDAANGALQNGGFCYLDSSNLESEAVAKENITVAYAVKTDELRTTVFFLNASVIPLGSTVKTMNTVMFGLSGIVLLCAAVFALLISLWITRPIEKINRAAKRLAKRDYSVHFDGKGYKEITELSDTLNYAAEELSKTDHLQRELVANISHDLRTPLTLISGYAEVMRDLPDEKNEDNLQIIIDESNRMKALVNDVLDISKIESGTAEMTMEPLALTNSIESELTRYNKLRDREGYSIEFIYDRQVSVEGDYSRLMQVVYNLVNNAVNYAGEDKKILVTQTVEQGKVTISVKDHGEGIPEEQLPLIWERYYKVDKTHKRATVGSGLGLSIVKGIVNAHKGTCGVSSTVGKGSTFWFTLDVLSETPLEN